MDMEETQNPQTRAGEKDKQVLAVIIRPEIETYRQAVHTQLELNDQYPEESHAYCEIVEIWRRLPD